MPCHVQLAEIQLAHGGIADAEMLHLPQFLQPAFWQRFTCLIMESEELQEIPLHCPMFHNLRRQLHKVTGDRCAGQSLETHPGKDGMQPVSELMQQSLHLPESEQGWAL